MKEEIKRAVADKIRKRLDWLRLNRTAFAEMMDQPQSVITKWLTGNHNFTLDTLLDIQHSLGINLIDVNGPAEDQSRPCAKCVVDSLLLTN